MPWAAPLHVFLGLLRKHRWRSVRAWHRLAAWLIVCLALQRTIRLDERLYDDRLGNAGVPDDPVFIVGHWRTGTTLLHNLLALDRESFAYPTNFQCLFPTVCLALSDRGAFARSFGWRLPPTRPLDNMRWDIGTPQEDELVYLPEGGFNYFHESMIFPRTTPFDPARVLVDSNDGPTREITARFFRKLRFLHGRRLVAKSPGHAFRLPTLAALFPKSRYVVIIRRPSDVVLSTMHMKSVFRHHASLQGPHADSVEWTAEFLGFYASVLRMHLARLAPGTHVLVRYEDLVRDPIAAVRAIYRRLDLPYRGRYDRALRAEVESLRHFRTKQYALSPAVREAAEHHCREVSDAWGYER